MPLNVGDRLGHYEVTAKIGEGVRVRRRKPDWDLSGAVEDLTFLYRLGARMAAGEDWPSGSETSEFRVVREAQR